MALDKGAKKLAGIVVDYSVSIDKDDVLLVECEPEFMEFAAYIGRLAAGKGAVTLFSHSHLDEARKRIERNDIGELRSLSKRWCGLVERVTADVSIGATMDNFYLRGVDSKKIMDNSSVFRKPVVDRIVGNGKEFDGVKWCCVGFPCEAGAKEAGMSLEQFKNFIYRATNIDWSVASKEMKAVKKAFDGAKDVHIVVPDQTDLHLSLVGRGGQICDGRFNMPDGEVFYGPVEDSVNGFITFPYPSVADGQEIEGIRLEYKDGWVVGFSAKKNQGLLEARLGLPGVKRIGELGIGCNYGIKRYVKNVLFDEKIGGTIHIALGDSYKESLDKGGGLNEADIHWDLVCDLRKTRTNLLGGTIYVNGKEVQRNGVWRL